MNKLKLSIIVITLLPVIALGQFQYNQGIYNVTVEPNIVAPGDIVSVTFDCNTYTPPHPSYPYVYWVICLDGTPYVPDGVLLAGQVYHDGDPNPQVFTISEEVTMPADLTEGPHTIKIGTTVHPTMWQQVGYFAFYYEPINAVPPIQYVDIDIKPGSDPNPINQGSNGLIPVAIFSSESFDATTVVPETVLLGGAGVAVRGKGAKYMAHEEDVDGDGWIDLIVQVETAAFDQIGANGEVILTGDTSDEKSIEGVDVVVIVPPE